MNWFLKIVFGVLAIVFFLQVFSNFLLIPVDPILRLFGLRKSPLGLFVSVFYGFLFLFAISFIAEIIYSLGFSKAQTDSLKRKIFVQFLLSFFTVWATFFSYGVLAAFKLLPAQLENNQFLSYYLFWFFILEILTIRTKRVSESSPSGNKPVFEGKRMTWYAYLFKKEKWPKPVQPPGKLILRDNLSGNIVAVIFLVIFAFFLRLFLPVLTMFAVLPVNPPEATPIFRLTFGVFATGIVYISIRLLGTIFARPLKLYEDRLDIPLSTLSNDPLFTYLLPRAHMEIEPNQVNAYKIFLERIPRRGRDSYHPHLKITLLDGTNIFAPFGGDRTRLAEAVSIVLQKAKKEELTVEEREIEAMEREEG